MSYASLPILSTIETVDVFKFPILTLGCKLEEDIMMVKFSVPSFSGSTNIEMLNIARVSPANTVTLYGPEL